MGKLCRAFKHVCSYYNNIHLVDKCLLVFMLILLLQSAYSLFGLPVSSGEGHTIDVIVRTSISAIFGYFLSVNFIQKNPQKENKKNKTKVGTLSIDDTESPDSQEKETESPTTNRLQVLVATSIGLFCLVTLILIRDLFPSKALDSSSFTATVSQFRDLVSGCVGFLIGCPNSTKGEEKDS